MGASEEDSDLSDSLSSACSTVPLASSELGSRAGSQNPPSPSTCATSAQPPLKLERRRKGRIGKTKTLASTTVLPMNLDKDHNSKKSRIVSRSHASAGPSTPSDADRPTKAESLPPLSSIKLGRRNSLSCNTPRATSAKGQVFDSDFTALPVDPSFASRSAQHPCTSHGRLPLFEQPVLLDGARPRRVATTLPHKSAKLPKTTRHKINGSTGKHRTSTSDTSRSSKQLSDGPSQRIQNYKDDESSLTEQSSSDEDDPSTLMTGAAFSIPENTIFTPSQPEDRAFVDHLDATSHSRSSSQFPKQFLCNASQPTTLYRSLDLDMPHTTTTTTSCVDLSTTPTQLSPNADPAPHALPPRNAHDNLGPAKHSIIHGTIDGPITTPPAAPPDAVEANAKSDRGVSEESALTPEPDDDRQNALAPCFPNITQHTVRQDPEPASPDVLSATSPIKVVESMSNCAPNSHSTKPPISGRSPDHLPNEIPISVHKSNSSRPSSLTIVPPSFTSSQSGLPLPLVFAHDAQKLSAPSVSVWEATSSSHTSCVPKETLHGCPPNPLELLTDEALDGVPITDDLMDYEMQVDSDPTVAPPSALTSERVIHEDVVPLLEMQNCTSNTDVGLPDPKALPMTIPSLETACSGAILESKPLEVAPDPSSPPPLPAPILTTVPVADPIYEPDDHVRRREEALQAMVQIEIRFAQLRDRLYIERMADAHRETAAIQQGSHPELNEYYDMLERKRHARLSLANKVYNLKEVELGKRREAATNAVWNKWNEVKADLRNQMITETQCQMKQVDREKCQPDLRYNVEVQLLPKPIIPQACKRRPPKRARLDYVDGHEETLALELRAAVAKRASINLSSLTAEESWMDLASMKGQPSFTSHIDPVNILRPVPTASTSAAFPTVPSATSLSGHCGDDRLDHVTLPSHLSTPCRKTIPNSAESLLMRSRHPSHQLSHSLTVDGTRSGPSSLRPGLFQHGSKHDPGSEPSRSVLDATLTQAPTGMVGDRRVLDSNRLPHTNVHTKTDRRPTLDAVMAHNTPERPRAHHPKGPSNEVTYCTSSTTVCTGSPNAFNRHHLSTGPSGHPASLYSTLPITVNYH